MQSQTKYLKCVDPQGSNGIIPVFCDHESLCKTVSSLPSLSILVGKRILQVGHWASCKFVDQDVLTFGNTVHRHKLFKIDYVVLTECTTGAINALVEFYQYQTFNIQRYNRDYVIFENVTLRKKKLQDSFQKAAVQYNNGIFVFKPDSYFVQQKICDGNHKIAWHLIVSEFSANLLHNPSAFFEMHDRDYWAMCINDRLCPKNTLELALPKQTLCNTCTAALNGTITLDSFLFDETEAETECETKVYVLPIQVIAETTKNPTLDPLQVMSLSEFF